MTSPIPIVLLHYNQPRFLSNAISSIKRNTSYPYTLFVVDNASPVTECNSEILVQLEMLDVHVIRNRANNWLYGFNLALKSQFWPSSAEYYVFSDCDIYVPEPRESVCWLRYLVDQMNAHACIGKLGLSLSLDNAIDKPYLAASVNSEMILRRGPLIGTNIVAPVDTTLAIYRPDFFVHKFWFYSGHAFLSKPYYYTCRTTPLVSAYHAGWDCYPSGSQLSKADSLTLLAKVYSFALCGAWISPDILCLLPFYHRGAYKFIRFISRIAALLRVVALLSWYIALRTPLGLNEIQLRARLK